MLRRFWLAFVCVYSSVGYAGAELKLPAVISDNMLLQRDADATLWGFGTAGETVSVSADWSGATVVETAVGVDARWRVTLRTPAAGGPFTLVFKSRGKELRVSNVLVGDVWLCSGQSNMEWSVAASANAEAELRDANQPRIRLFSVPNRRSFQPLADCDARWTVCTPETVAEFSAVGYFFARQIRASLDVPVGLIAADWGGTRVEPWMSERMLAPVERLRSTLETVRLMRDPAERDRRRVRFESAWWDRVEEQVGLDWVKPDFDDQAWRSFAQPGAWSTDGLDRFDGVLLCRKAFEAPAEVASGRAVLVLGPIDDRDEAWINGVRVGATRSDGAWSTPRHYSVPAGVLTPGRNVLSVLVLDTGGAGGLTGAAGDVVLRSDVPAVSVPLGGEWRYARGPDMSSLPPLPFSLEHPNVPTVLYNGMIAPLVPFHIRGVLWYQGESNRDNAAEYASLFPAMIRGWREDWGIGDFPFYYVQIAPFAYGDDRGQTAALREAQLKALSVVNTGMVVTTDIGDVRDIHPRDKQEVGRRLALWALANTYAKPGIEFSGPSYRAAKFEGGRLRLLFDHAGGLRAGGADGPTALTHFQIAGEDRRFVDATAEIDGSTVLVSSPVVPQPVAVRFGWSATAEPNLFNGAGLPASPFRTDDWP